MKHSDNRTLVKLRTEKCIKKKNGKAARSLVLVLKMAKSAGLVSEMVKSVTGINMTADMINQIIVERNSFSS